MNTERQFDNFDEHAENYNEICDNVIGSSGASRDYYSEHKVLELLKFENRKSAIKILDFGCGDGNSAVYIQTYFPNAIIYGVDVSEKSIDIANQKSIKSISFIVFNGKELPFDANEFDIVFTSMVFHHIEHKLHDSILTEIYKVLKVGGRLYCFEHNPNNPLTKNAVNNCVYDKDAVLLKSSYSSDIIKKCGLMIKDLNYIIFFPRHNLFKIFLGLEKMLTWCPIGAQYYIRAIK